MSTAFSIDFLHTAPIEEETPRSYWDKLANLPFGDKFLKPMVSRDTLYGRDGGFVFEHQPAFSINLHSGIATGLVGTLLFGIVGTAIATGQISPETIVLSAQSLSARTATINPTTTIDNQPQIEATEAPMTSKQVNMPPAKSVVSAETVPQTAIAKEQNMKKSVLGFLPYWFVDEAASNIQYDKLTTLAYFDIEMNPDGSIDTNSNGWKKLQSDTTKKIFSTAVKHNVKVVLTFSTFEIDEIESIVSHPENSERAINSMVNTVNQYKAAGANIDFEYQSKVSDELRHNFSRFTQQATQKFHAKVPGSQVTVSTYATSALYPMIYDLNALAKHSDGLFVMAYDYSTVHADRVGPVSPLSGAPNAYWYDVETAVEDYMESGVMADKIILGVPYYGYDWPTSGSAPKSVVVPGKALAASYSVVKKAIADGLGERKWDFEAQVPYFVYTWEGQERIIYYDDAQSLGKKYDMINGKNLQGVGIWALGQEGSAKELWQLLEEKFGNES